MKIFNRRTLVGVAFIVAVSFASGCADTPIRQHPDFATAARKVHTVAILPPDVEHVRIVFNGDNERLTEKERTIAEELAQGFETSLKNKGYTIRSSFAAKQEETKKNMDFELHQVGTAYNEAAKQLFDKPANEEESKKYRVSLGPVVNPIASFMDADALIYVRYYGFEKSGGQQTKDIVAGALLGVLTGTIAVPSREGAALEMALIDGATGDVLWANRGSSGTGGAGTLGFGAANMASTIVTKLPGNITAVAENEGDAANAADSSASVPTP